MTKNKLIKARLEKGYSQEVLADLLFMNQAQYSRRETGITKIKLKVEKTGEAKQEENSSIENQIVTQVQKIKKVNTKKIEEDKETSLEKSDIQNLKQFLIEEYEVNEKCLEIN